MPKRLYGHFGVCDEKNVSRSDHKTICSIQRQRQMYNKLIPTIHAASPECVSSLPTHPSSSRISIEPTNRDSEQSRIRTIQRTLLSNPSVGSDIVVGKRIAMSIHIRNMDKPRVMLLQANMISNSSPKSAPQGFHSNRYSHSSQHSDNTVPAQPYSDAH